MNDKEITIGENVSKGEITGKIKEEYPKLVEKLFTSKKKTIIESLQFWKKDKIMVNPILKEPLLFLMRNDGYTDVLEGLTAGRVFTLKDKESNLEKGILLKQNKLTSLKIEPYPKCWFAHEDEMLPYPTNILNDSEELVGIIRKMETTKGLLKDEAKLINAKMMFWLAIMGMLIFGAYMGFKAGWFGGII
jgi:hypothetical protein